jgi:hypothetical protein
MKRMQKKRKVHPRKQREPSNRPVLPRVCTRSVLDEHPDPEPSHSRQASLEQVKPTPFQVDTAVHSCSVCGRRLCNAVSLRCVLKLK